MITGEPGQAPATRPGRRLTRIAGVAADKEPPPLCSRPKPPQPLPCAAAPRAWASILYAALLRAPARSQGLFFFGRSESRYICVRDIASRGRRPCPGLEASVGTRSSGGNGDAPALRRTGRPPLSGRAPAGLGRVNVVADPEPAQP